MPSIRRTSVAGHWYPDDRARLIDDIDAYIARANVRPLPSPPRAIVAPHAGLLYSGPVAAFAYAAVLRGRYDAVVLIGPSHFVPFRGASLWPDGAWDTPLGPLPVDVELGAAIRSATNDVVTLAAAHGREHSLEMQLPFIARLMPEVPIVPLVMGHQTRATSMTLGDAVARAIEALRAPEPRTPSPEPRPREPRPNVLLVASSDLSHYEDANTAATLDAVVLRHVEALDPDGLMTALEHEPRHACGGGPMVSVLSAARALGATQARVLQYADSGDVSGDKSSVVGYMAAAIW